MFLSFLRACARSKAICIRSQVSGVLPNAFESRIAISGLMPDLPLITLVRVCRETPRAFAPSVTDKPKGSRHAFFMLRPGWGGLFIGIVACSCSSGSQLFQHQNVGALEAKDIRHTVNRMLSGVNGKKMAR